MAGGYVQMAETLTRKALDKAASYLSFNSAEVDSLLKSIPGSAYIFYLLLKPHHPDMTEDLAYEIMSSLANEEVQRILTTVRGQADAPAKNDVAPAA
jgi:hypothetical protein